MSHTYDVGTKAWQPDTTEGWVASEVEQKIVDGENVTLVFALENGESKTIETTLAALNDSNASLPPLMNPSILEASDDLTNLSHLNEPAVLQAIKLRYAQKEIYTYSGIVLIATNPFARVDSLYVPGMVQIYAGKHRSSQAPHLFAIAEEAFADMLRDGRNQTIVVSVARWVDPLLNSYSDYEDSIYGLTWSSREPWIFASLSYDGRVVVESVKSFIPKK